MVTSHIDREWQLVIGKRPERRQFHAKKHALNQKELCHQERDCGANEASCVGNWVCVAVKSTDQKESGHALASMRHAHIQSGECLISGGPVRSVPVWHVSCQFARSRNELVVAGWWKWRWLRATTADEPPQVDCKVVEWLAEESASRQARQATATSVRQLRTQLQTQVSEYQRPGIGLTLAASHESVNTRFLVEESAH